MEVNVEENSYIPNNQNNILNQVLKDTKVSFVLLLIVIVAIYIGIFFLVGNSQGDQSPMKKIFIIILEVLLWVALIVIIYINITKYDNNNNDFQSKMENLFNNKLANLSVSSPPEDDSEQNTTCTNEDSSSNEVFHIPNNKHTYEEAKEICENYDARLASYEEIEEAYLEGGNWCSYGWSKDQLALFPTQKEIYNNLKKIPGHEHDCGRPGINGGYIKNPNVKFGVNCYGIKPKKNKKDEEYMIALNNTPVVNNQDGSTTQDAEDIEQKKRLVAPFNNTTWSQVEEVGS